MRLTKHGIKLLAELANRDLLWTMQINTKTGCVEGIVGYKRRFIKEYNKFGDASAKKKFGSDRRDELMQLSNEKFHHAAGPSSLFTGSSVVFNDKFKLTARAVGYYAENMKMTMGLMSHEEYNKYVGSTSKLKPIETLFKNDVEAVVAMWKQPIIDVNTLTADEQRQKYVTPTTIEFGDTRVQEVRPLFDSMTI